MNESLTNGSEGKRPDEALQGGVETGTRVRAAGVASLNIFFNKISHQQLITSIQDEVTEEAFEC